MKSGQFNQQQQRPDAYSDPRTIFALVELLAAQFAKTIVVFLRWDFGERYFNISDFLGSAFTFLIVAGVLLFWLASGSGGKAAQQVGSADYSEWVLGIFFLCFFIISLYHRLIAWLQRATGRRRWHSRYPGTSYLRFLTALPFVSTYTVQRFVEPALAIVAGSLIYAFAPPLSAWFIFAGLCLAMTENFAYRRARNRVLDALDAEIEGEHLDEPEESATVSNRHEVSSDRQEGLDPALQAILDLPEER